MITKVIIVLFITLPFVAVLYYQFVGDTGAFWIAGVGIVAVLVLAVFRIAKHAGSSTGGAAG
jgi:hypothetical protein